MKKARLRADDRFKRSLLDTLLDGVFRAEPLRPTPPHVLAAPPAPPRGAGAFRRKRGVELEPLEPRLLMSADLSFSGSSHAFTLTATSGGALHLVDNSNPANFQNIALSGLSHSLSQPITIQRSDINLSGDTLTVNMDTLAQLNTYVSGHGGSLTLQFLSDNYTNQGASKIVLTGTNANGAIAADNIGYNLAVQSESAIASSGAATVQGNLTLNSSYNLATGLIGGVLSNDNTGITLTGANLSTTGAGHAITLQSTSNLAVAEGPSSTPTSVPSLNSSGALESQAQTLLSSNLGSFVANKGLSIITSYDTAGISISGNTSLASAGDLDITSTVSGSLTGTAKNSPIHLNVAVVVGGANPYVSIAGSNLTSGGAINVTATTSAGATPFSIDNETAPADNTNSSNANADGAVAVTVFDTHASVGVAQSSVLNAQGGAATLTANGAVNITTVGNAGAANTAGAGVAVSALYGDTSVSIDGSGVTGAGVSLGASSTRTITTTADASSSGSSSSGNNSNASENTLSNNNASASDGAGGSSSVSIAGAVAVATDTGATVAYVNNGAVNAGTGAATVSASPSDTVTTTASGTNTASGGSVGVGVGVAINIANRDSYAYVTGADTVTAKSLTVEVQAPAAASSFTASATSGFGSSNVGIAGSLAINVVVNDNEAFIGTNAALTGFSAATTLTLTGSPDLTVSSASDVGLTDTAMPGSGNGTAGKVGIGASIAIDYGENTTLGYIESGATVSGAHNVSLTAASIDTMSTNSQNGAASGNVAVTPVIAISIANDTTAATLGAGGTGGSLTIAGAFSASSTLSDSVQTIATGNTTASNVGVGISIALSIVNDNSTATTTQDLFANGGAAAFMATVISGSESNATASTAGDSSSDDSGGSSGGSSGVDKQTSNQKSVAGGEAQADETKAGNSKAKGATNDSSPSAQSQGGSVNVAGAVAVNIENATSQAYVPDHRHLTATGVLTVQSMANVDSHAISSGSAISTGSSGVSIGVGVSVNVVNPTNLAYVGDDDIISSGGLSVSATMADRPVAAPAVTPAVVTQDSNTTSPFEADSIFLGLNSGLKTGDEVKYNAELGTSGNAAIKGLTDGSSYYANVADDGAVRLYDASKSGAKDDAIAGKDDYVKLTSAGAGSEQEFYPYITLPQVGDEPNLLSPIKFNPTGNVTLLNLGEASEFRTGDRVAYDAAGGTAITGITAGTPYYLIDITGGYYQLAASQDDAFAGNWITATTGAGNANQLVHDGTDSTFSSAISGASGGSVGVAGSLALNLVNDNTQALVGLTPGETGASATTIATTGAGAVSVTAAATQENYALATPAPGDNGGGKVGVGASVSINIVGATQNLVNADLANGVAFTGAIGALTVSATGDDAAYTHAENGAAGASVSIGVGAAVPVISDTVTAYVGTGGLISGSGNDNVTASLTGLFVTETDAKAAGSSVGVGASISVAVVDDNVTADVARAITTTGGYFNLAATSTVESDAKAVASVSGEDSSGKGSGGSSQGSADGQASNEEGSATKAGASSKPLPSAGSQASSSEGMSTSSGGSTSGGGDSSGVGVAAAVSVNVLKASNLAEITGGASITASGALTVSAQAQDNATAKAVGSAVAMSNSVNIGAAVGLNYVSASNKALVGSGGSTVIGAGVTVQAITPTGQADNFIAWGAAAAGGKGTAQIAGSVGINIVTFNTEAATASDSHLESSGGVTVTALANLDPQTLGAAGAFSQGGNAIGATIVVAVLNATTLAHIDGKADAAGAIAVDGEIHIVPSTLSVPAIPASADPKATSVAVAGAASSGDVAIGGSFIVNVFTLNASAYVGGAGVIDKGGIYAASAGQTLSVHAVNDTQITSIAGALGLTTGDAGVGVGLDVEIISKTTLAYIAGGAAVSTGGGIAVKAESLEQMLSIAATAGVADEAGIAASISVAVISPTTEAYIGSPAYTDSSNVLHPAVGATVTAGTSASGGGVSILATDGFTTSMIAGAVGAAGSAGIGLANTTLVVSPTVEAFIVGGSVIKAAGTVSVGAQTSESLITIAAGIAVGGSVGVAGSAAVNVFSDTTTAYVGPGATITTTTADINASPSNLTVAAQDVTSIVSVAGSLAAGGDVGAGVGADVGVFGKRTNAYIDSGVTTNIAGNILVSAFSSETLTSVSAGVGVGTVGIAANAGVHLFNVQTRAFIGDDPNAPSGAGAGSVLAQGSIYLSANDVSGINEIVGVLAAGEVGVGAAIGVNIFNPDTESFIGAGANVTGLGNGLGLTIDTGAISIGSSATTSTVDPSNPGGVGIETSSGGTMSAAESGNQAALQNQGAVGTPSLGPMDLQGNGGSQSLSGMDPSLSGTRTASLGTASGFHGVAITASNRDEIRTFTLSLAAGLVGVAVSAGVDIDNATTSAYVGANAKVNTTGAANAAQSVLVGAGVDFYHLAVAGTLAAGAVGVAPAVGVNIVGNTTNAYIGQGATVDAAADIAVNASASENAVMIGFGIAAGVVGVGGAVDVLSISNVTTAAIQNNAVVYAGGNVFVLATDDTHVFELSGALAGGLVGVGGSVGVMLINKTTTSVIDPGAFVDALGATSALGGIYDGTTDPGSFTTAGGDSLSGGTFDTTSAHGVIVQSESSEDILHIVAAGAGGFVGVSGAVGVTLINASTQAQILAGAKIDTLHQGLANGLQSVYVNAVDDAHVNTYIIGIAGGFVGVSGAVDVGTLDNNVSAQVAAGATVNALDNVAVDAVGLKTLSGFDVSGAGGFVGVGGAVSVWAIGTQIQASTQDQNGNSTGGATQGKTGSSADGNAGTQAKSASGSVTSGNGSLGNFGAGSGGANSSQSRVQSATSSASSSINAKAPTAAQLAAAEAAAPPAGTSATLDGTANAGKNINVLADEQDAVSIIGGQVSGGVVGAGASVAILTVADNASAHADGTLHAGLAINVNATLNENVGMIDLDGAVGFVGIGAAVAVVTDNSVTQATLGNVAGAGAVLVNATSARALNETTGQISVGAVAAGASFSRVAVGGGTYAAVDDGANVLSVASLGVNANSTVTPHSDTVAISGGIGAFSANFAFIQVTPQVWANIGSGATVNATGAVSVNAQSTITAEADMFGVSAGELAVGVSYTQVTLSPDVLAELGDPNVSGSGGVAVTAASLTVLADTPLNGDSGLAKATGSAGALIGVTSTNAAVHDNTSVRSLVGSHSTLNVSGVTDILAVETTQDVASADSNAFGLVAAGIATSTVTDHTNTVASLGSYATLGTGALAQGSLSINATSDDHTFAYTDAGSGGAIAGAAAVADTTNDSTTTASSGADDSLFLKGYFVIGAEHTAAFNAQITTFAGGLLAGAGALIINEVTANTTASVGANAFVSAPFIQVTAQNVAQKPELTGSTTQNVLGTTGGLASIAGASDSITISFYTLVSVGNNTTMVEPGLSTDNPTFTLSALNTFNVYDSIAFTTGGAVSGAAAYGSIRANGVGNGADQAHVTIGTGANLTSSGVMTLEANGGGNLDQEIATDTYGAGTATIGTPTVDLRPDNEVTVGSNATLMALGDLDLLAGTDANYNPNFYTLTARFDGFAGSAIPISDVHAVDNLFEDDFITINAGANAETARTANLLTPSPGPTTDVMTAQAKAESWVSDLQQALLGSGALLAYQNASAPGFAYGVITDNGTVQTGLNRHQTLILGNPNGSGGWNQASGQVTQFSDNGKSDQSGGITFQTGTESISDTIVQQIALDQGILNDYGSTNSTLSAYYQNAIGQLEAELAADNLVDPTTGQPLDVYVMTVNIDPITADAGHIFTQATQLAGSGAWIAPSDASVTVTNYTPAFLNIYGITIPDDNGGLYYNGVLETQALGDADITSHNNNNLFYIRTIVSAAGNPTGVPGALSANFAPLPNPSSTPPVVVVDNVLDVNLYNANNHTNYPWPNIQIMSTSDESPDGAFGQGIVNDTGTVILATAPGGLGSYDQNGSIVVNGQNFGPAPFADSQGSIPINNQVQAGTLVISTNGTLLVNLPGQVALTGSDPEQTWDSQITGATYGVYDQYGDTAGGVVAASPTTPNSITHLTTGNVLAEPPVVNSNSLNAPEIIIKAATVNLDGLIQSGQSDYDLTLGAQAITDIESLIGQGVTQVTALAHQPSANFVVYWQPSGGGSILVSPTRITGGDVEITGNVVNTGNGQINVLGGYGNVNVTNNTPFAIEVQQLDVSSPGIGTLLINDTSAIGQVTFDANALRNPGVSGSTTKIVDTGSSTIAVAGNPGVVSGQAITYNTQGSTPIGGLNNGQTYYVAIQADGTFRLYNSAADALANGGTGNNNFVHLTGTITAANGPVQAFNFTPGNLSSNRQAGHVYTTLYQESAGNIAVTTNNGVNAATTTYNQPTAESYSPMSSWRYGWTVGVTETVKAFSIQTSSSWIGLISTGGGYTGPFDTTIPQGVPQLVGAGPYYYTASDSLPNGYAFSATTITQGTPSFSSKPLHTTTTWYGTTTITVEHDEVYGQQILDTHEISGARPVGIQFTGYNQGTVTVNSLGNVIIGGPILNPTGTTTITSQGSIETAGNIGVVGGAQVVLQANKGIGDIGGPLQVDVAPVTIPFDPVQAGIVSAATNSIKTGPAAGLETGVQVTYNAEGNTAIGGLTDGANYFVRYNATAGTIQLYNSQSNAFAGGATGLFTLGSTSGAGIQQKFTITTTAATRLDATTVSGAIDLAQVATGGDLPVDVVSSLSLGAVTLSSHGSILVANGGAGLVSGGAISLIAANNIGASAANPLLVDTPSATDITGDKLTVTGLTQPGATSASPVAGNVYIEETTGDLQVNTIQAAGDVWIDVPNGSIINANTTATVDQRTEAQLLSGVWSALSLTDATGYQKQLQAVVSTYVSAQEQSYQTYWQFRSEQPDPSVYDPNFQVTLTAAQLTYYQGIGYTPAQITTLQNAETAEYHVLAAEFSGFDSAIVDVPDSIIYLGGSQALAALQTGDQVTYVPGASAAIAFTQGGVAYSGALYARNLGNGLVKFYSSQATAAAGGGAGLVNFTYSAAGSGVIGASQSFTFTPSIHFNPASASASTPGAVSFNADSIFLGASSGLTTGQAVTYDSEGAAPIGGLTSGQTYYVQVQNDGTVRLYATQAQALAGAAPATVQFNASSSSNVVLATNALIVGTAGGLTSGQQVTYDSEGAASIGGLTSLGNYYVNVQNVVDTVNSAIFVGFGAGLSNGEAVVYSAQGNSVIGGLTNGVTYYVHLQTNGAIRLYASASDATAGAADFIALTTTGGGAAQQFAFGVGQSVTFNPNAVALRLYTDAADATTGGATNLVALTALGGGSQNRLVATGTGLVLLGPGATGADNKFVAGAVSAIAFNPTGTTIQRDAVVNTTANSVANPLGSSIYVGFTSGLQTGDAATYNPGAGNASIAPLNAGSIYYVNVQSNGTILLYDTQAHALAGGATGLIALTSTGGGTAQSFAFSPSVHFNPNAPSVINPGENSIFLPQGNGLNVGDAVQYDAEGSAASFGLTNGQTYYVNLLSDGSVTLYATQAQALAGAAAGLQTLSATTGAGTDQKLVVLSQPAKVTFNPGGTTNFIYTPTAQQINALTAGIKKWTPNELLYGISQGLLTNSVTDTVVAVQATPDVSGAHVTLLTGGGVGKNAGTLQIPVVAGGTFTTPQLLALATAERSDLQFLGAAPTNAVVNFSGNAITLISDGATNNWLNDGFAVGDFISIAGAPQNSTSGGSLDQITALTSTVMTLSKAVSPQTHASITIAPVVANPVFQALPLTGQTTGGPESVNVNFLANGFDNATLASTPGEIVRDDGGSWIADGFQVGNLVQLTGPSTSNNSTGAGLAYTITAITDASNIAFNPTAPGAINASLDTVFVGANTGLSTGAEITYNDRGNTAIGGLTNGANYYVYVEGDGSFELYDTQAHANAGAAAGRVALSLPGAGYGGQQSFAIDSAITAQSTLVLSNGDVIFTEGASSTPESISIERGQSPTIAEIQVTQVSPVWVNASARLDVVAGTSVFIDSQSDVRINQVVAGETANYQGNIRIYTIGLGTNVVNASVNGAPNLEGQNLILESGSGGIGGAGDANPITIDLVDQGTLTARAQNDVSIKAVVGSLPGDNQGSIYLASVYSSSGNAYLTASGSILDAFGDISTIGKETQVQANNIYLFALNGSIGGLISGTPDFIGIDASQTGAVYAYALNNVYLYQTTLNFDIGEIFAQTGDVDLQAQTYIYNQPNQITDVFGNNVTLTSILTGIGTAADNVSIYSHYGYDQGTNPARGTLTASAITDDEVNIYVLQNDNPPAPVALFPNNPKLAPAGADNIYLNTVVTGTSDVAFITAPLGSILDSGQSAEDVQGVGTGGGNTLLFALNNIGAANDPISTQVGHIEGQSTLGSTWVTNTGALSIGGSLISGSATGMYAGGSIVVVAQSPVTVNKSAISEGDIDITANNDGSGGDNIVVQAVTLTGAPLVLQALGNIVLTAGNNITVNGPTTGAPVGAQLRAGTSIVARTPAKDGANGNVITIGGELQAPTILIHGGAADSVIQVTTGLLDAVYPWTPASWPFANPPAGLTPIAYPLTPSTTSQISIYGDGGSEQILLWGSLIAARTDVYSGTGFDQGTGNALIALNPLNADGYVLNTAAIAGPINLWGNTGNDTFVVNDLNSVDFAHKSLAGQPAGSPTSVDPGLSASGVTSVRNTININGGAGSNQYDVNLTGASDYIVNVNNSDHAANPANGSDTLTINGVPGVDTFLLRTNFVALLQYSSGVLQPTYERINYNSSINVLDVNGLEPYNYVYANATGMVAQVNANALTLPGYANYAAASLTSQTNFYVDGNSAITTLTGADGGDNFQFGQVFGSQRVGGSTVQFGDQLATIQVALGQNSVGGIVSGFLTSGPTYATTAYGGAGNDNFFVYSNKAPLKLYGEAGNDDFVVRAFALAMGSGVSTALTTITTGSGSSQIEYNINAPVAIDGGSGVNTVTVLGSGFGDSFVITNQGVQGAGLNVSMTNVSILQVDGVAGDNAFYVLSTAPGEVVTLIGGTGNNNTFDIAGDVTTPVIAQNLNGVSGLINNSVSSADTNYSGAYAPGVSVNVANGSAGTVVVGQLTAVGGSTPIPQLFENPASGPNIGKYTINLAANPTANVYLTVAAALRPYQNTSQGSASLEVSIDGVHWMQSLVLTFTAGNYSTQQTVYVKAIGDTVADGQQTIVLSHSTTSANAAFNDLAVSNLEVKVVDQTLADAVLTPAHTGISRSSRAILQGLRRRTTPSPFNSTVRPPPVRL